MMEDKVKILLVDDEINNLRAMKKILAHLDIQILEATSGNDALRLATIEDIALILLDIKMPEMDGYEVAELLRYEEETEHIPIIFMTAYHHQQQHVFKGYEVGAVDYLFKPINPYILQCKINVFVALHRQKQQIIQQAKTIRQAQKMALLGTLSAGIAHNFNNLLVPMLTFGELSLKQLSADHNAFAYLQHVVKSAQQAKELVAQILLFARQDEHQIMPLSLATVMGEALDLLKGILDTSIVITTSIKDDLPLIKGNASKLHQLLMNLCINAADAMPEGGTVALTLDKVSYKSWLTSQGQTLSGDYVRLQIEDSGCGMDEKTLGQSFEPFFSLKQAEGGTGLGLPMVLHIMEQHKGGIEMRSQVGQGTCIQLYFPVAITVQTQDDSLADKLTSLRAEKNKLNIADMPTLTMLFVEDEASIRNALIFAIEAESKDIKLIEAASGVEALEIVQNATDSIDIVVTDQTMPRMTGLQLAKKLRMLGYRFPIILSTGYARVADKKMLEDCGIDAVIQKPYKIETFLELVHKHCKDDSK